MEERIIDREKKIKLKRVGEEVDAVDDAAAENEEDEVFFGLPDGGDETEADGVSDDDVGLSPEQMEKRLEERRKREEEQRAEFEKLVAEGDEKLAAKDYAAAAPLFARASFYAFDDGSAERKLWLARTENYTNPEALYDKTVAMEFAEAEEEAKGPVLAAFSEEMKKERTDLRAEAEPIRERFTAAQKKRGEAFSANRKYYLVRFLIVFAVLAVCAVSCGVSSLFLLRTQSVVPLALTIAFGAAAAVVFAVLLVFARKLYLASRLVRENEDPASTEDGARLAALDARLACLDLILGE